MIREWLDPSQYDFLAEGEFPVTGNSSPCQEGVLLTGGSVRASLLWCSLLCLMSKECVYYVHTTEDSGCSLR